MRAGAPRIPVPALAWGNCPSAAAGGASTVGFKCSTATVPMDYAKPAGGAFHLALIKYPAEGTAGRLGTLFWNPGGPSDAGTEYLPAAIKGFPIAVRRRFDIVSWDPRGMGGRTTPVAQCFDNADQEAAFTATPDFGILPITSAEFAAFNKAHSTFNQRCVRHAGDLLSHVSTADNARDLDLLRQAVGDEKMNYYGTSYGTFLGATYINMFPGRLRSAVLDGAVSPAAWAGGKGSDTALSTFLRIGSDFGAKETVAEFIRQCGAVAVAACAFSAGSPQATTAKWADLLRRVEAVPVDVEGQRIDQPTLLGLVQGSIYILTPIPGFSRFPGWPAVAEQIQAVWKASGARSTTVWTSGATPNSGAEPTAPADSATSPAPVRKTYVTSIGRQLSVICGESPNPTTAQGYVDAARTSYRRTQPSYWPFVAYCLDWTAKATSPYGGPWNSRTSGPVLVVGNTFDPATPYASSQSMAKELGNGRLLTVNGFGHTELLNPSTCAQQHIAAYLIDLTLPPEGTSCRQDRPPFPSR